jgi:microcystin-dependent protein
MADKFVFSNFATTALREPVDVTDTEFLFNIDDVPKFPTLVGGAKFPIILSASDDLVEIVYVSDLSMDGTATVERGMEGTQPQSWLAGTHVRHAFTAASVIAAGGIRPRGTWSGIITYETGDMVETGGISYVAKATSLNQAPGPGSAYWQVFYQPPGAASTAMNFQGVWSSSTTYAIGQVVTRQGRLWQANAANTNSAPAFGNANWTHIAKWSGPATYDGVLAFAGTNNYTVTIAGPEAPTEWYDGLTFTGRFANTNTTNSTLTPNALAAKPLRFKAGVDLAPLDLQAGELYKFTYIAATDELIAHSIPGQTRLSLPVGIKVGWPSAAAPPTGWLLCDGLAISRTTYAALFAKLGTSHGAGDGSTTFNLPDYRGRFAVGRVNMGGISANPLTPYVNATAVGVTGGDKEPAAHTHAVTDSGHDHGYTDSGHTHTITDPGHTHSYTDVASSSGGQSGTGGAINGSISTLTKATGSSDTGITVNNRIVTSINIADAVTGIAIQTSGTGVDGNLPPLIVEDVIIFAGV